jgi:hypothetical protein
MADIILTVGAVAPNDIILGTPGTLVGTGNVQFATSSSIVPHSRTMLYQSIAEPVPLSMAAEAITVDKWQAPFGQPIARKPDVSRPSFFEPPSELVRPDKWLSPLIEPIRRRGYSTQTQDELSFVGSDAATDARWLAPFSEPVRWRRLAPGSQPYLSFCEAAPFAESVSIDKWQQPFSEPKRFPKVLPTFEQPYAYFVKADPFPEAVSTDRWQQPLSEPMRRRGPLPHQHVRLAFVGSDTATDARWFYSFSEPVRRKQISPDAQSWSYFAPATGETVTVDKYYNWLAEPVRVRSGLPVFDQQALVFVKADPFPEAVSIDRWLWPLSEPKRFPAALSRAAQPYMAYVEAAPFAEAVSIDKWQQPLSDPTRRIRFAEHQAWFPAAYYFPANPDITVEKWFASLREPTRLRLLPTSEQPYLAFVKAAPFTEAVSIDRWQQPLSEPTRRKRGAHLDVRLPFVGSDTARDGRWFSPFSNPILRKPTVYPSALIWSHFVSETTTVDKWFAALREPVLPKRGLPTQEHPYLSFVKAAPFAESVSLDRWFSTLSQPTRRKVNVSSYLSPIFIAPTFQIETVTLDKWFSVLSQPTLPKVWFPTLASSSGQAPYVIFMYDDHSRPPRTVRTSRTDRGAIIVRADPPITRRGKPANHKRFN